MLGCRWDCEKTCQAWSSSADITIVCSYLISENIKLSKFTFLNNFHRTENIKSTIVTFNKFREYFNIFSSTVVIGFDIVLKWSV